MKFQELTKDLWVFPGAADGHNSGVVVGARAVLLIDPGGHERDRKAVAAFLTENAPGREVQAVVFTSEPPPGAGDWPGAHVIGRGAQQNGVSLPDLMPGWELLALGGEGGERVGAYHAGQKVLFCGEMLAEAQTGIPHLTSDSQGYLDALTRIEEMSARLVVPLRGAPAVGKRAIRARIEGDRNYIHSLLRHVLTTQAANLPLERALEVASEIYEGFPFLQDHLANMRAVWGELE
jgi:hypothetical protein